MVEPVTQRKTWDPAQAGGPSGAKGPSGNKRGLECRWCGCKHFRVVYTLRHGAAGLFAGANVGIAGSA
jgi:hypothetical protein